jgi:hypothetical protein
VRFELRDRRRQAVVGEVGCLVIPRATTVAKSGLFAGGGLALGLTAALAPPHLPQLILLPSIGLFLAVHTWGQRARVGDARWTCPGCGAAAEVPGAGKVWGPDCWLRCPACQEPVQVVEGAP